MNEITLKNIKIIDAMSEETICFTANVYENGKQIGIAQNEGHGGNTNVYLDPPNNKTYEEMDALEEKIDELVGVFDMDKQKAKIQKKLDRDCVKHICVGWINEHGANYYAQGFNPSIALADLVMRPKGLESLQRMYDRIKTEIKGDETILNTNLEALGVII